VVLAVWELRVTLEVRRYYTKQNILLKDYLTFQLFSNLNFKH